MALDESHRHELHERLEDVLGPRAAGLLMSQLPPVSWADVATKRDLAELEFRLVAELHKELGALKSEMLRTSHTLFFSMAGLVVAAVSLAFAAARLGGG